MTDFDFQAHDAIVEWMRSKGVTSLEVGSLKIVLGPAPRAETPVTEEQRTAEQLAQRRRDLDILFSASSIRPKKP